MSKNSVKNIKNKLILAAVLIGTTLGLFTFYFVKGVQWELWEQSVGTITESTQQGCNTLRVQLRDEYENLQTITEYLSTMTVKQQAEIEQVLAGYRHMDKGICLYFQQGNPLPSDTQKDENAEKFLWQSGGNRGIIDPHISSATGVRVFNLYVAVTLQDGVKAYLVKEYEIGSMIDSFCLSFYNDAGFSYVVNTEGDILIRPPHPNSNKTVQNVFDMLGENQNEPEQTAQFGQSLKGLRTGWAVFSYQQEDMVFCYTPLKLGSDWYFISIIPKKVVDAQTNKILTRTLVLISGILVGIFLLVLFYFQYASRTNRRLKSHVNYTEHLYNAVPEGIAVMAVKWPYYFIQLNKQGLSLLNYPQSGFDPRASKMCLSDILYPEDAAYISDIFQNAATGEKSSTFEIRILRADHRFFWAAGVVEKTLDENEAPVLIAAFRDITDEKKAREEKERIKLQERLTLVGALSNAYSVIVSLNLTTDRIRFIHIQSGLMLEIGAQRTYTELYEEILPTIHPDHLEEFKLRFKPENIAETLGRDKKEVFIETKQKLRDGNYHWIFIQIIYVDNPYSSEQMAILISRRIDEQRYEEEQQRQALQSALDGATAANQAKSRFLSNMSHDIRTPMNAIIGMTDIALRHVEDPARVSGCLRKIDQSSKRLLSLINDILDMSKIESGKISIQEEPFDFAELVSGVVEMIRPEAEEKQLQLTLSSAGVQDPNVIGDSLRIWQICMNILSNAIKYTPPGGTVSVEITQEAASKKGFQRCLFSCADTGIGMEPAFMERLFKPFERTKEVSARKISGTGLGMAITKNLVDIMNGDIEVRSTPGNGSVFTVTLLLEQQGGQHTDDARDVPVAVKAAEYAGKRILLVEDNEINREIARTLLEEMEIRVEEAYDGAQAVRCVSGSAEGFYDLVLMDIQMPEMNGYEATSAIRKLARRDVKTMPIIAMTANAFDEDVRRAKRAGMSAHFAKPFDLRKLQQILFQYLGQGLSGEDTYR